MHYFDYIASRFVPLNFSRAPSNSSRSAGKYGKSMKNNFACSLRYFREKERVTRCALHVFHSVKRTANNFVINCIKLSVRKTVYAPASSRVCGTINWTARARFIFFFLFFSPPLSLFFFFILFLHRAGEFDVSNSQDALIRFYRPLVQILGIHIDCNWNEKYEIRRWP